MLDPTPTEATHALCEPCVAGFEHVLEVADDSIAPIMRHLQHERYRHEEGKFRGSL